MFQTALLHETSRGNLQAVRRLIDEGADVNHANRYGVAPLMVACLRNWSDIAKLLLESGADTECRDAFFGCTPLIFASLSGGSDCLKLLLKRGANVNAADSLRRTPLLAAISVGNVEASRLLRRAGARIDGERKPAKTAPGPHDSTALARARYGFRRPSLPAAAN
jgi:uncharacterized protein